MRAAVKEKEVTALNARYADAVISATARGAKSRLEDFEGTVNASKAVMNRTLGALHTWIMGGSEIFLTFHRQVEHQNRVPADDEWDAQREAAESAINPYCYRDLSFAALTLGDTGMEYYGPYAVTLKSLTIEDRASVFEQNPFLFNVKHRVIAGQNPPLGYRTKWADRGKLAATKLQPSINATSTEEDFNRLLMGPDRKASNCDFVEVHVFGPINRLSIERITGPRPGRRADKILLDQLVKKAQQFGAIVEVTS